MGEVWELEKEIERLLDVGSVFIGALTDAVDCGSNQAERARQQDSCLYGFQRERQAGSQR